MKTVLFQVFLAFSVVLSGSCASRAYKNNLSVQSLLVFAFAAEYVPTLVHGASLLSSRDDAATDLWEQLGNFGGNIRDAEAILDKETAQFADAAGDIKAFEQSIRDLIVSTNALRIDINSVYGLKKHHVNYNFTLFTEQLSDHVDLAITNLAAELMEPVHGNQTENFLRRNATVSMVLDTMEGAIVEVYALWDVPEVEARERFAHVKTHIRTVVLAIGNMADKHPVLVDVLVFTVVSMIIPEVEAAWILRPILRLFGFGPLGPVKGSLAAAMQRQFFGATVKSGSWFAKLQSAAMKKSGFTAIKLGKALSTAASKVVSDAIKQIKHL